MTSTPQSAGCVSATTSCTVTGLTNGTAYTFQVSATNASGTSAFSLASAAVIPIGIPSAPQSPVATSSDSAAAVSWLAPADNGGSAITSYVVTSTPQSAGCSSATMSCTVAGLTNGTPYTFFVAAINAAGTGPTSATPAVTPVAPVVPPVPSPIVPTPSATAQAPTPTPSTSTPPTPILAEEDTATPTAAQENRAVAAPSLATRSLFSDQQQLSPVLEMHVKTSVGSIASGERVTVNATGLAPLSKVTVTIFSAPQVIARGVTDERGNIELTGTLPRGLSAGNHSLIAEGTNTAGTLVQSVGGFSLDDSGVITSLAQPGQVTQPLEPGSTELSRAIEAGKPIYDVALFPAVVASVAVAGAALAGLAGVGGLAGIGGQSGGRSNSRGKLATVVTKKLKAINVIEPGPGDKAGTWKIPGTTRSDAWIKRAPVLAGRWSALMPRVLVDGTWSRAIFGSGGFILWIFAALVGIISSFSVGFMAIPPNLTLLTIIIVLGILDAAAGMTAWLTIMILATVTGHVTSLYDLRTALGMFVLMATIPLLAHVIRPLRRKRGETNFDRLDLLADYVMPPIFLSFAAAAMFKALNGLSGLLLVDTEQAVTVQIVVIVAYLLRRGLEDVAAFAYPQRSAVVQPVSLPTPSAKFTYVSVLLRIVTFLIVAAPFFGLGPATWLAAAMLALPMALKPVEDRLPNSVALNKWYPRGVLRFAVLLVVGILLSSWLLGDQPSDGQMKGTYAVLLIPATIAAVLELFGREGFDWKESALKRVLGLLIWMVAVGLVTGLISL